MNIQQASREVLSSFWHGLVAQMVAECSPDVLHKVVPGSSINSIAATYAHMVMTEDLLVQARLKGVRVLFESEGWDERTGIAFIGDPPMQTPDWASGLRMDVDTFRGYATAVHAATDAYLANLPDDEVDRTTQGLFRETSVGRVIVLGICTHFLTHAGEISALKGTFGLKGLPF
jgi:hypothetical protein